MNKPSKPRARRKPYKKPTLATAKILTFDDLSGPAREIVRFVNTRIASAHRVSATGEAFTYLTGNAAKNFMKAGAATLVGKLLGDD